MNREAFDHVIRAAGAILGENDIIVIGSQAVLGSVERVPITAERSIEVDVLPVDGDEAKADLIDGSIGEASMFQEAFGVYAQGVGPATATLPSGWRDRLVPYRSLATNGVTALCLEIHDLAVSKLVAGRDKDADFVSELFGAALLDLDVVLDRLTATDVNAEARDTARARAERWHQSAVSR